MGNAERIKIYVLAHEEYEFGEHDFLLGGQHFLVAKKNGSIEDTLKFAEDNIPSDTIQKVYERFKEQIGEPDSEDVKAVELKLYAEVAIGPWVQGIYFAHEYGKEVEARARRNDYMHKDGTMFHEYEVECLDKDLSVLDGIWEDPHGNGFGDTFEPMDPGKNLLPQKK